MRDNTAREEGAASARGKGIRSRCGLCSGSDGDTFVGITYVGGDFTVSFPYGFHLSSDDKGAREDVRLLLRVLSVCTDRRESEPVSDSEKFCDEVSFPLRAYVGIILDFMDRGYYRESEAFFGKKGNGRIDWARTIKTQRPYINGDEAYYLGFVTRNSRRSEDETITLIHEYCVYEAFEKAGWLFTDRMPKRPRIAFDGKAFRSVLTRRLRSTFNGRDRELFRNMLAVVSYLGDPGAAKKSCFGTRRFEYVWENMVDRVFGTEDKEDYLPRAVWHVGEGDRTKSPLEPDTVMMLDDDVYVLDSKYYKYGVTGNVSDLPGSASVNKQITYGEYVYGSDVFRDRRDKGGEVYNAFILPYDADKGVGPVDADGLRVAGYATGDWKTDGRRAGKKYEIVTAVMLDTKRLMRCFCSGTDSGETEKLSGAINGKVWC